MSTEEQTTTRKARNTTGPLDEFTAAARITRLLERASARLVDVEKTVREAVEKERQAIRAELGAIIMRVPEAKRDRVAKLVVTAGQELCGFELHATANDPTPAPDPGEADDFPSSYGDPGEPTPADDQAADVARRLGSGPLPPTDRIERDEQGSRRVGKARQ